MGNAKSGCFVSDNIPPLLRDKVVPVADIITPNQFELGYLTGKVTGQPEATSRTMAVEVGMQNSGMAATLATAYLSPLAALPGAVFSVWHNLSGAVLALIFRAQDRKKQ